MNEVKANGIKITYTLERKRVKNINLRIKADGSVWVSANKGVPQKVIDSFVLSKADFIINAQEHYKNRTILPPKEYLTLEEIPLVIEQLCKKAYPIYERRGIAYPEIKLRKMVSRWGSCHHTKGILTFNTNLRFAPLECIEYVVLHEFTHFLQPNHSVKFYEELSKVCPNWKVYRKRLKEINIR